MATKYLQRIRAAVARWLAKTLLNLHGPVEVAGTRLIFDPRRFRLLPRIAGGAPEDDGDGDGSKDGDGDGSKDAGDGSKDGDGDGGGGSKDGDGKSEPDWKRESRKHETRSKAEKKRADDLQAKLDEIAASNQTEQEKAIAKAREEAKAEALSESQTERRNDRLEVAVARQAAKTFADVDDALLHIQRGIAAGDIDADHIFDDKGKVQTDALTTALEELLERKPHLKAGDGGGRGGGSSDAGKGSGGKDLDEMDVEAHLGAIKRTK